MKNFLKKFGVLGTGLALAGLLLASGSIGVAHADNSASYWIQNAPGVLMTNTPSGLATAAIHVGSCYIGTGTGTPCGGGGGGTISGDATLNQIAYGSATDTITSDNEHTINHVGFSHFGTSSFGAGESVFTDVNDNLLGFGISGQATTYINPATSAQGISLLGNANPILGGDQGIFSVFGALDLSGDTAAGFQGVYNATTDAATASLSAVNSVGQGATINLTGNGSTQRIQFAFGSNHLNFPNTAPNNGDVLTGTGSGNTAWLPMSSSVPLTENEIAYGDSSGFQTSSSGLMYDPTNNIFNAGKSSLGNGTNITMDDNTQDVYLGNDNGNFEINAVDGTAKTYFGSKYEVNDLTGDPYFEIDQDTGKETIGPVPTLATTTVMFNSNIATTKTITPPGTTGDQTINTTSGSVRFAALSGPLTVTSSIVDENSIITPSVISDGTNTMTGVTITKTTGSFTIYPNNSPTSEIEVDFIITN